MHPRLLIASALIAGLSTFAQASDDVARISDVRIKRDSPDQPGIYHIKVTIEHKDTGWDDYVEAWEMVGPDGAVLAVRPFFEPELERAETVTALAGVVIPQEIKSVTIRARRHPDGLEGASVEAQLPD